MKVFKFGGASVKDASAVRNVSHILSLYPQDKLLVVISAMGKTTNKLEEVVNAFVKRDRKKYNELIDELYEFHLDIAEDLFSEAHYSINLNLEEVFENLRSRYDLEVSEIYGFDYDQIVSYGELMSTLIVEAFLSKEGHRSFWIDARKVIRTNNSYREGEVNWKLTEELFNDFILPHFEKNRIGVTQGFIGHTSDGFTTTLGREGSDFTAGILAYISGAQDVTIWKDVPGMLNADPKRFTDTIKLGQISFKEAIELSYYGASVIHPKTIKPLQNKGISLFVKSFIDPRLPGTIIQASEELDQKVSSFIFKEDQMYMSFTPKDFSFIAEVNLGEIFQRLALFGVKINLMQNSALSFSIVFDSDRTDLAKLCGEFKNEYELRVEKGLELVTVRHYDEAVIERISYDKDVLITQQTKDTVRLVLKPCKENVVLTNNNLEICELA